MSARATGAARERSFEFKLWSVGYRTARISASGKRTSDERKENGIGADIIGIAPEHSNLPHVLCEVGGVGKRLGTAFGILKDHPLSPGFACIVARCVSRSWVYYTSAGDKHDDFASLIGALHRRDERRDAA